MACTGIAVKGSASNAESSNSRVYARGEHTSSSIITAPSSFVSFVAADPQSPLSNPSVAYRYLHRLRRKTVRFRTSGLERSRSHTGLVITQSSSKRYNYFHRARHHTTEFTHRQLRGLLLVCCWSRLLAGGSVPIATCNLSACTVRRDSRFARASPRRCSSVRFAVSQKLVTNIKASIAAPRAKPTGTTRITAVRSKSARGTPTRGKAMVMRLFKRSSNENAQTGTGQVVNCGVCDQVGHLKCPRGR